MTAEQAIAALDRQLAKHGDTVTLYRYDGQPRAKIDEVTVKGFVRPVKNDELVGDIKLDDIKIILSPTGLGGMSSLKKGHKALVNGRELNIELPKPTRMQDVLVRYDVVARG